MRIEIVIGIIEIFPWVRSAVISVESTILSSLLWLFLVIYENNKKRCKKVQMFVSLAEIWPPTNDNHKAKDINIDSTLAQNVFMFGPENHLRICGTVKYFWFPYLRIFSCILTLILISFFFFLFRTSHFYQRHTIIMIKSISNRWSLVYFHSYHK